jgi:hypothetical protein
MRGPSLQCTRARTVFILTACLASAALAPGCRRAAHPAPAAEPLTAELASGRIRIAATVHPPAVRLHAIRTSRFRFTPQRVFRSAPHPAPSSPTASMASLLPGSTRPRAIRMPHPPLAGRRWKELHARLTPLPAARYRLAPMALAWSDSSAQPPARGWIQTASLVIPAEPLPATAGVARADMAPPIRIPPSLRALAPWILAVAAIAALAGAGWFLARRIRRAIQLRRMSPRERALLELAGLIARGLIASGEVKAFYFELTMIVRRYIERRHAIRAPEQTTEEFLAAARRNPRFNPAVLERLRAFLEAADLVKYAARRPDPADVDRALETARTYISADEAEAAREDA